MNILFLTRLIPNPYSGASIRPFNLIKNFSGKYQDNISLISFSTSIVGVNEKDIINEIQKYCKDVKIIQINGNEEKVKLQTFLTNFLSPSNILSKLSSNNGVVLDPAYYNKVGVQKIVDNIIDSNTFDLIYCDSSMAGYVAKSKLLKIVEPLDINYKNLYHDSIKTKNLLLKFYWFCCAILRFFREIYIYKRFNYCVVVTETDKKSIETFLPNLKVIPNGVDINYFKPINLNSKFPSLVFTGVMNGPKNVEAVLFFYSKIFPIVKDKYPSIILYLVGQNPSPEILELGKDPSLVITGFVEDLRPYVSNASIFICPHISGSGIKNKVLEAMSMGKAVVSTSVGALGIKNNCNNEYIIISDDPFEFASKIIELLSNECLRRKIEGNARNFIVNNYSWDSIAKEVHYLVESLQK
jgi:glycosyltransferase involved in cell wall biosynthesis